MLNWGVFRKCESVALRSVIGKVEECFGAATSNPHDESGNVLADSLGV